MSEKLPAAAGLSSLGWMPTRAKAVKIAAWYFGISCLWIFSSGWLLHHLVSNVALAAFLEDVKGWVFVSITALLLGWVLHRDFRHIRVAAERLRDEQDRLRLIGDNLPDSYVFQYMRDSRGRPSFTHVSAGVQKVNGLKVADLLQNPQCLLGQIDPDQWPAYAAAEAASAAGLNDFQMEVKVCLPDNQRRLIRIHSRPVRLADGSVRWDGFVTDVTASQEQAEARRKAEESLRNSERLLNSVINLVPHPIFAKDRQGRYLLANAACAAIHGLVPVQMLGKDDLEINAHREQAERLMRMDREVIESGQPRIVPQETLVNAAGHSRMLQITKIPFASPVAGPALLGVAVDITELTLSEQNYREIFNATTEAIFIHDATTSAIVEVNDTALRMFGYDSKAELISSARALISGASMQTWEEAMKLIQMAVAKGPRIFEWTCFKKDGGRLWVEVSLRNTQIGGCGRVLAVVRDITVRKTQQMEIERLSRLYATLSEVNQAIVRCQSHSDLFSSLCRVMVDYGKFSAVQISEWMEENSALKIVAQVSAGLAEPLPEPPPDVGRVIAETWQTGRPTIANESAVNARERCTGDSSCPEPIHSCAAFPISLRSRIWGVLSVCSNEPNFFQAEETRLLEEVVSDISFALERMQAEEASQAYHRQLRAALVSMADAVFISDVKGRFIEFNDAFATFHKFKCKDECARTFAEYPQILDVYSADGALVPVDQWAVPRALRGEVGQNVNFSLRRKDTGEQWVGSYSFAPIRDDHGAIVGSVVVGRDITDQKRAEEALYELNRTLDQRVQDRTAELRASNEELDAFAYAVSHDLRAPLRAMTGFSRALVEDFGPQLPAAAQEYLTHIQTGSRDMGELVDGLLRLARCTRGLLERTPVDLSALASRILQEHRQAEPARQVTCDIEPGLVADGDARLLEVVMRNLLGNAWKYTSRSLQPSIRVRGHTDATSTSITVSDNGAGFDMKHVGKLFQPFQRLHREEEFPGIGIGLATVLRIIRRHGGTIAASGVPGAGAQFIFTLPK